METQAALADLVASLAALGRSMQEKFDPQRFLAEFSAKIQRLVPHDRLVLDYLDDDGRTFTVFAEHACPDLTLHEEHYTTTLNPAGRYVVAEWAIRGVFGGQPMRIDDFRTDPRFARPNAHETRVRESLRSATCSCGRRLAASPSWLDRSRQGAVGSACRGWARPARTTRPGGDDGPAERSAVNPRRRARESTAGRRAASRARSGP
jgi:hypothetical protein